MLLDKAGGNGNQRRKKDRSRLQPRFFQRLCRADTEGRKNRTDDMDTGNHIGIGVSRIDRPDHVRKEIIPWKDVRAQVLTVGKQDTENHTERKADDDAVHIQFKLPRIFDHQINTHSKQQHIP